MREPLAILLRPNKLDDIIGQDNLVGKDGPIRNFVDNKKLFSMILYGNPGIGKTSIANAIVNELDMKYRFFNAVTNDKKDLTVIIEEAKLYGGIILILDEIHRLNKDKQDILLPHLESGLITLIGLTTSNPYHRINPAIRSRCAIFKLNELNTDDIIKGLNKAIKSSYLEGIKITKENIKLIAKLSSTDLRSAYNLLEMCYYSKKDKNITKEVINNITTKPIFNSDKDEQNHYNLLSAFQKSIRGSDVNASLHYLSRLILEGDLDSIYRRMTIIAYEDIGLASPNMGLKVEAAINASERVGLPEARIILSKTIIEMALSPKSNSSEIAIDKALEDLNNGIYPIPDTITINSKTYKYPHDYKGSYVKQQYMPDNLIDRKYYKAKLTSQYEKTLNDTYEKIEKINKTS